MAEKRRFWRWQNRSPDEDDSSERVLLLSGPIDSSSWIGDEVTPQMFRDDLNAGTGDITVWVNSPGGDCTAAAQIYNMLRDYKGKVTVKIDGIAASAASVVAMAGDRVLMSPVSMMMIHNPSTIAMGNSADMQKAIEMLDAVKDSIINAYRLKSGLSRSKISQLMDDETWLDANKAVELHFADGVIERDALYSTAKELEPDEEPEGNEPEDEEEPKSSMLFPSRRVAAEAEKHLIDYCRASMKDSPKEQAPIGRKVEDLNSRLDLMKQFI